jgi:hypothetical protein
VRFGLTTPGLRGEAALAVAAMRLTAAAPAVLAAAIAPDLADQEQVGVLAALQRLKPPGAAETLVKHLPAAPVAQQAGSAQNPFQQQRGGFGGPGGMGGMGGGRR